MLALDAALALVLEHVSALPVVSSSLGNSRGLTLGETVVSDSEAPPFDKALMDGYAIRVADLAAGSATLPVRGCVSAGTLPSEKLAAGSTIQVMTGAVLPEGTEAVIRVEDARREGTLVTLCAATVRPDMNIMRRGAIYRRGETILPAGTILSPPQLAVLAELGIAHVSVHRRPTAAVLATGNELVPHDQLPGPGQIRNSNEPMLVAQLQATGVAAEGLGIARDDEQKLREKIQQGLNRDLFVLSGGVSAGLLDLVPSTLAGLGVQQVFHKVDIKPGKPVWFGVYERPAGLGRCVIFGLPGNPVSSMVCCELFVRTAVRRMMRVEPAAPQRRSAVVSAPYHHRSDRPTFHPARLTLDQVGWSATLLPWLGSSDLRCTVEANGMAILAAGERTYQPGERVDVMSWTT